MQQSTETNAASNSNINLYNSCLKQNKQTDKQEKQQQSEHVTQLTFSDFFLILPFPKYLFFHSLPLTPSKTHKSYTLSLPLSSFLSLTTLMIYHVGLQKILLMTCR